MKILSLNVQNFLRIEALEIIPKGNTVTITGKNDQGKSSTLRALDAALGGGKAPKDPVHHGANKASIVVHLGDEKVEAIVERTYINRDDDEALASVKVTTPDGARWNKPQEFLDKLLGALSLDPVKFLDMKPEAQAETVRAFSSYDFAANDKANKADYDQRTIVNRDVKRLEGEIAALPSFPEGWPTDLIVTDELVDEIEEAADNNNHINSMQAAIVRREDAIAITDKNLATNQERIDNLKRQMQLAEEERTELLAQKSSLGASLVDDQKAFADLARIDIQTIRDRLDAADENNAKVREFKQAETRRGRLQSELEEHQKSSAALTAAMEARKAEAAKAIAEAKMPVDGLGFNDEGRLTLNGFEFENVAFSKRLLTAISIAAAHSPKLRLVKITEGDKLDDEAQQLLAEFADKHDLQIWQETVQHGEPIGFVIEDGKLKGYSE